MNSILAARFKFSRPRPVAKSACARPTATGSRALRAALVLVLALPMLGCSSAVFIAKVRGANERFEEAKAADAEKYSPYEYYAAEARLGQSKQLAADAEYGSAIQLANESTSFSERAIVNTKKARAKASAPKKERKP
jgi:hypothetical protein